MSEQIHIYSYATYCARVDSNTVILVVAFGAGDDNVSAIANVKAVSVFAQAGARLVIDSHVGDGQTISAVDADCLDGGVLDVEVGDGRGDQIVSIEEFWLGGTTATTLAIPPAGAVGVEICSRGTTNLDSGPLDLEQGSSPFFIAPGCLPFKDDLQINVSNAERMAGSGPTVVSSGRSDRSRVTPDGTAMLDRTMVEHDFWEALAEAAPLEPEKVQLVARFTRLTSGAGVTAGAAAGSATGEAKAEAARAAIRVKTRGAMVNKAGLNAVFRCVCHIFRSTGDPA